MVDDEKELRLILTTLMHDLHNYRFGHENGGKYQSTALAIIDV
jgi:hypothetical protein